MTLQQLAAHQRLADAKRAPTPAHVALAQTRTANPLQRRDTVRRATPAPQKRPDVASRGQHRCAPPARPRPKGRPPTSTPGPAALATPSSRLTPARRQRLDPPGRRAQAV